MKARYITRHYFISGTVCNSAYSVLFYNRLSSQIRSTLRQFLHHKALDGLVNTDRPNAIKGKSMSVKDISPKRPPSYGKRTKLFMLGKFLYV